MLHEKYIFYLFGYYKIVIKDSFTNYKLRKLIELIGERHKDEVPGKGSKKAKGEKYIVEQFYKIHVNRPILGKALTRAKIKSLYNSHDYVFLSKQRTVYPVILKELFDVIIQIITSDDVLTSETKDIGKTYLKRHIDDFEFHKVTLDPDILSIAKRKQYDKLHDDIIYLSSLKI